MEDSESIVAVIRNVTSVFGSSDFYITDRRIAPLSLGNAPELIQFGLVGALIKITFDKLIKKEVRKSVKSDGLPKDTRWNYENIHQVRLQDAKHLWTKGILEIKRFEDVEERGRILITLTYDLTHEQFEMFHKVLPDVDPLKGKLII
jgi:hypothetical protein